MTTEKLTLDWCFKYPKASIKYRETEHHFVEYPSLVNLILSNPNYELQNVIIDSVLILRPLSSLTEKECVIVDNLDSQHEREEIQVPYSPDMTFFEFQTGDLKIFDYLRSINIDIDGLQERGIAIYE